MSTKRILVTGATGFVGRHLVPRLERERHLLTLAVRQRGSCPQSWCASPRIRIFETGNIETSLDLDTAFSDVAQVVHLAGHASTRNAGSNDIERLHDANVTVTNRLVEAALKQGVESFVHLSSVLAIADHASPGTIDDRWEGEPTSAYGRSKRQAERAVARLAAEGRFSVSLRPPLIVGPDAKGNWAALLKLAATGWPLPFGSIRNRRSLISVASAADIIAHLCAKRWPPDTSGAYCVADPDPVSTREMVTELRNGMGLPPRIVPFPPSIISAAATLTNQRRGTSGLLGSCELNDTRFRQTFGYHRMHDIRVAIRQAGASAQESTRRSKSEQGQ